MSDRVGAKKPIGLATVELAQFFTRIFYRFVFQSLGFSTFFVKVLRRRYREIDLVYPKRPERLPVILSEEEVARLIESASTSYHRVILMTLYGTSERSSDIRTRRIRQHALHRDAAARRPKVLSGDWSGILIYVWNWP